MYRNKQGKTSKTQPHRKRRMHVFHTCYVPASGTRLARRKLRVSDSQIHYG